MAKPFRLRRRWTAVCCDGRRPSCPRPDRGRPQPRRWSATVAAVCRPSCPGRPPTRRSSVSGTTVPPTTNPAPSTTAVAGCADGCRRVCESVGRPKVCAAVAVRSNRRRRRRRRLALTMTVRWRRFHVAASKTKRTKVNDKDNNIFTQ